MTYAILSPAGAGAQAASGAAWRAQDSGSSQNLYGVAFGDATHGCAVGEGGVILATASGGLPPAPPTPSITRLRPASGKRGALVTITGIRFGTRTSGAFARFGGRGAPSTPPGRPRRSRARCPQRRSAGR